MNKMGLDQEAKARRGKLEPKFKQDDKENYICHSCESEVEIYSSECGCCGNSPYYKEWKWLANWRGHSRLHAWMEALWEEKGRPNDHSEWESFNCKSLPLTLEDVDRLEADVKGRNLNKTKVPEMYSSLGKHLGLKGLFGDDSSDEQYLETDLKFCEDARLAWKDGYEIFYTAFY